MTYKWQAWAFVAIFAVGAVFKTIADRQVAKETKRASDALDYIGRMQTYRLYDHEKEKSYPRPHMRKEFTVSEYDRMMKIPGCTELVWIGYDNQVHPDYCRP